jgi:hypothetical protein
MCPICGNIAWFTAFCVEHTPGWVKSDERKQVNWLDADSYNTVVALYVENTKKDANVKPKDEDDLS